ncbi:arsenite methyltransferase [Natronorarus salvus]|uniref:arsenite methyltransferase n=1 Tax=Natronorarus salvus TaxID=3117733 RepID=UPI002F26711A
MSGERERVQRAAVRERYGRIAESGRCCSDGEEVRDDRTDEGYAERLGYEGEDVNAVEAGANLGLGCGNPTAIASLEPGETVLDLGSGGGFDCFLAAREVGEEGRVIGVDMTPEMVERARENAEKNGAGNVEFRLGEIEHLPVPDSSVDVIVSNCVINLSPAKARVFEESFRVLEPGGRLAVSDVVAATEIPAEFEDDLDSLAGCVAGAATVDELEGLLSVAGFEDVRIEPKEESAAFIGEWSDDHDLEDLIVSATIEARKPT